MSNQVLFLDFDVELLHLWIHYSRQIVASDAKRNGKSPRRKTTVGTAAKKVRMKITYNFILFFLIFLIKMAVTEANCDCSSWELHKKGQDCENRKRSLC